jgi:hypothetical protein
MKWKFVPSILDVIVKEFVLPNCKFILRRTMWWTKNKWLHKCPHFDISTWSGRRLLMSLHNKMPRALHCTNLQWNFLMLMFHWMKSSCCGGMIKI